MNKQVTIRAPHLDQSRTEYKHVAMCAPSGVQLGLSKNHGMQVFPVPRRSKGPEGSLKGQWRLVRSEKVRECWRRPEEPRRAQKRLEEVRGG